MKTHLIVLSVYWFAQPVLAGELEAPVSSKQQLIAQVQLATLKMREAALASAQVVKDSNSAIAASKDAVGAAAMGRFSQAQALANQSNQTAQAARFGQMRADQSALAAAIAARAALAVQSPEDAAQSQAATTAATVARAEAIKAARLANDAYNAARNATSAANAAGAAR